LRPGALDILTSEQLTGRAGTHVVALSHPACSLHPEAGRGFVALAQEAADVGIDLAVSSSFRDFGRQLAIWNDKFRGRQIVRDASGRPIDVAGLPDESIVRAILTWSALPGASRHHWGSDLDVYDRSALAGEARPRLLAEEYAPDGVFARLSAFLARRAAAHGFFLPYDRDRGGVAPEPWHLSYAPLATEALARMSPGVLADALSDAPLEGVAAVRPLLPEIYERYVCRVAPPPAASGAAYGPSQVRLR
jgi:LAS superfamily LD-carboxypeptidase LdcB